MTGLIKKPLLDVKNLSVMFPGTNDHSPVSAIKNISFTLNQGETLGIIGESGSGKSVTLLALMGLIDLKPGITSGSISLNTNQNSIDLLQDIEKTNPLTESNRKWHKLKEKRYQAIRGNEISMIFQNPKLAFNPYYSIGSQINEMIRLHTDVKDKKSAKKVAIEWLGKVKMEAPAMRYNNNPYGLSGGMCQRAMIAMALASEPSILIADEPTTGLDATIQSNIVDLLANIKVETDISMIVVSHDFNVMCQLTDQVIVYYNGRIIEQGPTNIIFDAERKNIHPYTKRLLKANLQGYVDASETPIIENQNNNGCDFFDFCTAKDNNIVHLCESKTPELVPVKLSKPDSDSDSNPHSDSDSKNHSHNIRCWKFQHDR